MPGAVVLFTGVRLYFAVCPFNSTFTGPSTLTLVHVRLPPGFCTRSSPLPSNIHAAYYRQGALLLASCLNEDRDILWVVSGDSFPFQKQLVESQVGVLHLCCLPQPFIYIGWYGCHYSYGDVGYGTELSFYKCFVDVFVTLCVF